MCFLCQLKYSTHCFACSMGSGYKAWSFGASACRVNSPCCLGLLASPTTPYSGINISHLAKRKLIFKRAWKVWDILISRWVYIWNTQGHHEKERKTILEFLVPSWNRNDFSSVKTHHLPGGFCQVSAAFLKSPGFVYCGKMTEQRYLKYEYVVRLFYSVFFLP